MHTDQKPWHNPNFCNLRISIFIFQGFDANVIKSIFGRRKSASDEIRAFFRLNIHTI